MAEISDFRLGAQVVDVTGKTLGTLVSVLVDQEGFDPRAVVVKDETTLVGRLMAGERFFITDEVVIPISSVAAADHNVVRLSMSGADLRRQPPYLSYRLKPMGIGEATLKEAQLLGGGLALPDAAETADKPVTEIEIDKDENVMLGTTGKRLGKVEDVLFDEGELIAVVIRRDGLRKHDVVLPIRFLSRGDDMALFAAIDDKAIEHLQPFAEN